MTSLQLNPEFMPASMEASDGDEGDPFLLIQPEEAKVEEAVMTAREEAAAAVAQARAEADAAREEAEEVVVQARAEVVSATAARETALQQAAQANAAPVRAERASVASLLDKMGRLSAGDLQRVVQAGQSL